LAYFKDAQDVYDTIGRLFHGSRSRAAPISSTPRVRSR
jgi:hypothetical protein